MNSPPPPPPPLRSQPPPPPALDNQFFSMELPSEEPSSTAFEWSSLLDFNFEDQFHIWSPENQIPIPASDSVSDRGGSDGSEKIRKRDPRLTCENFLAGRIPCSCPELDEKDEEEGEVGKKRPRKVPALIRCQVPGCEVDISELKGYHKRHRVCLRCANSTSVVLDGQHKRYCQQCGKFHLLPDFDEGKRSCRRKLERHNRRRRKAAEFKGGVGREIQDDQLAEDVGCEDKTEKDETLNESEDGDVSPLSSHPGSQSIQSGSIKSFVTLEETQMEGGKNSSKCSSFGDNKNAYSSMCPTGRISFKLYDWNPAEFPRRLRHQIFQWLASMPVELEGYIRPGCTILTVFIAMPHFMWQKLLEDTAQHIHSFVNAPESMLFGRGSMTVYLNDMIFRVLKGATSVKNVKRETLAPRLHYVHPSCFEAGKPMEFVACGSNLLHSRFRFLVSFAGRYLAYDDCLVIPYGTTGLHYGTKDDSSMQCEHQIYKIYISSTDATLNGPAFVEVESEYGISNFIPVLFGDIHVCSEMKIVQQRFEDALSSAGIRKLAVNAESQPCEGFASRQTAMSELLLDIGWLLKEPKLDDVENHLTSIQIQRFNYLLNCLIRNESTIVLERILCSLKTITNAKSHNCDSDADMRLFHKIVEHAREIVHPRLQDTGVQVLHSGSSVEKADYWFECNGEKEMPSNVHSTEEMKAKKTILGSLTSGLQQSDEVAPLLNKEIIMNFTNEPHQSRVLPQKTCSPFRSTTIMGRRSLLLMMTAAVFCFGICAVFLHPTKVGAFAVSIRRCMFGSSKT